MGQVLHVPANPSGKRTVLIIVVHGREVAPRIVAAGELHEAGFEIDAKPFPEKQKKASARRRVVAAEAGTKSRGREKQCQKAEFKEHPIGLIAREILRGGDKREKPEKAPEQRIRGGQM